jgi:hypothetical protein
MLALADMVIVESHVCDRLCVGWARLQSLLLLTSKYLQARVL